MVVLIGDKGSETSYQMRDSKPYAGTAGMLSHINGKFTMGNFISSLLLKESSFMTYHRGCRYIKTMGATSGAGTAYHSGAT
jgi:hypothetical protein